MRFLGFFAIYALYAASFFLPAFVLDFDVIETQTGWAMFRSPPSLATELCTDLGWEVFPIIMRGELLGMFGFGPELELTMWLGWLANPVLWMAICCSGRRNCAPACLLAGIALVLGLAPMAFALWLGGVDMISQFLAGYYLWLASMALACALNAQESLSRFRASRAL